ncbi:hypothetical protein ACHAQI_010023 [Fusarium lateritium]
MASYGPGSLDVHEPTLHTPPEEFIIRITRVSNVSCFDCLGSLVTHTNVKLPDGGPEAVLSRWDVAGCTNCQHHPDKNSSVVIREDNETVEMSQSH